MLQRATLLAAARALSACYAVTATTGLKKMAAVPRTATAHCASRVSKSVITHHMKTTILIAVFAVILLTAGCAGPAARHEARVDRRSDAAERTEQRVENRQGNRYDRRSDRYERRDARYGY